MRGFINSSLVSDCKMANLFPAIDDDLRSVEKLKFNVVFVGDDWQNTDKWNKIESDFNDVGVAVVYFPYTKGTSSTLINDILINERKKLGKSN